MLDRALPLLLHGLVASYRLELPPPPQVPAPLELERQARLLGSLEQGRCEGAEGSSSAGGLPAMAAEAAAEIVGLPEGVLGREEGRPAARRG